MYAQFEGLLCIWIVVGAICTFSAIMSVPNEQAAIAGILGFLLGPFGVLAAILISIRRAIEDVGTEKSGGKVILASSHLPPIPSVPPRPPPPADITADPFFGLPPTPSAPSPPASPPVTAIQWLRAARSRTARLR